MCLYVLCVRMHVCCCVVSACNICCVVMCTCGWCVCAYISERYRMKMGICFGTDMCVFSRMRVNVCCVRVYVCCVRM